MQQAERLRQANDYLSSIGDSFMRGTAEWENVWDAAESVSLSAGSGAPALGLSPVPSGPATQKIFFNATSVLNDTFDQLFLDGTPSTGPTTDADLVQAGRIVFGLERVGFVKFPLTIPKDSTIDLDPANTFTRYYLRGFKSDSEPLILTQWNLLDHDGRWENVGPLGGFNSVSHPTQDVFPLLLGREAFWISVHSVPPTTGQTYALSGIAAAMQLWIDDPQYVPADVGGKDSCALMIRGLVGLIPDRNHIVIPLFGHSDNFGRGVELVVTYTDSHGFTDTVSFRAGAAAVVDLDTDARDAVRLR